MSDWIHLRARDIGKRAHLADAVGSARLTLRRRATLAIVVADGVGDTAGAQTAAERAVHSLTCALSKSCRSWTRGSTWKERFQRALLQAQAPDSGACTLRSATTVAVGLVHASGVAACWAGDSRVYVLDESANLIQVTADHHDACGSLTSYLDAGGRSFGPNGFAVWSGCPTALFACTDGVHRAAERAEIEAFVRFCVMRGVDRQRRFECLLGTFLRANLSDNYAAGLVYRARSTPLLNRRLAGR